MMKMKGSDQLTYAEQRHMANQQQAEARKRAQSQEQAALDKAYQNMKGAALRPDLTWDKPAKGTIRAGFLGRDKVGSGTCRADIASFLIDELTDDSYQRAMPAISN